MSLSIIVSTAAPLLTSLSTRTPVTLLFGAARSMRVRTFVVLATGKLAPRSVSVGAPEASLWTSCQFVWAPRWKPMQLTTAERVVASAAVEP